MTVGDAQMRREAWGTAHHIAELQEHLATGNALNSKAVQGGPIRKRKMRGTTTQWKWAILAWLVSAAIAATPPDIEVGETRSVYVKGIEFSLSWNLVYTNQTQYTDLGAVLYSRVLWNGEVLGETFSPLYVDALLITSSDLSELKVDSTHLQNIVIEHSFSPTYSDPVSITVPLFFVPGALTLFPPAVVILVAATTREVLYALYLGIFCAAFIVQQYNPFTAFLRTLDKYLVNSLGDVDHAFVILFTWILSGLIANISKSGGSFGIARIFRRQHRLWRELRRPDSHLRCFLDSKRTWLNDGMSIYMYDCGIVYHRFAKSRMSSQLVVFFLGFVVSGALLAIQLNPLPTIASKDLCFFNFFIFPLASSLLVHRIRPWCRDLHICLSSAVGKALQRDSCGKACGTLSSMGLSCSISSTLLRFSLSSIDAVLCCTPLSRCSNLLVCLRRASPLACPWPVLSSLVGVRMCARPYSRACMLCDACAAFA
eukprot:6185037-Pleurochrysis_carterae.AAC.2